MVIKRDFIYSPKGKNRRLHIYLPDNYEYSDERYPVMYFFDGHNIFFDEDATYGKSWGLKTFLDSWPKPMIIVGIECGHEGNERLSEYCPYKTNSSFAGFIDGMGDETLKWITEEIKPMIDEEYRTYSFREATGICGSSMGGLMALYAGIKYNTIFSKAACLSSAVRMCMGEIFSDIESTDINPDTRFYLSWGTEEAGGTKEKPEDDFSTAAAKANLEISEELIWAKAMTRIYCQRYGSHCEADWEKQVPLFMNYLWLNM